MTEDEAKQKWCPKTFRPANPRDPLLNAVNEPDSRCIASECMAWRTEAEPPVTNSVHGYCGLAGKP